MDSPLFPTCMIVLLASACNLGGHDELGGPESARATTQVQVPLSPLDPTAFNVEQHTCALYVALRSHALESSISFGRDLAQVDVHWNMCPGGTMVACATTPAPGGKTVVTGIPWPYGPAPGH